MGFVIPEQLQMTLAHATDLRFDVTIDDENVQVKLEGRPILKVQADSIHSPADIVPLMPPHLMRDSITLSQRIDILDILLLPSSQAACIWQETLKYMPESKALHHANVPQEQISHLIFSLSDVFIQRIHNRMHVSGN